MSADVLAFLVFANSSRGLMARVILPTNVIAVKADIAVIEYSVFDKLTGEPPAVGTLDVDQVMYSAAQPWSKDNLGYTFLWPADGSLWPDPNKRYRVKLVFTMVDPYPAKPIIAGKKFVLAYDAKTVDSGG